jgi:hypothetical protein
MLVLPKRAILWVFVLAVVTIAVAALTGEAAAQVYQGPLDFSSLPPVTMTVTLQPFGPALYRMSLGSATFDTGILTATVSGSFVAGYFQSSDPTVAPCFFQGNYDGTTATLALEPATCGDTGTLTLTRIS